MKFEVYTFKVEKFKFCLKSIDEQIVLTSGEYDDRITCLKAIESVRLNSSIDCRFVRLVSKGRNPYFNLKSFNNQIIGISQIYSSVGLMEQDITLVKNYASNAILRDITKITS